MNRAPGNHPTPSDAAVPPTGQDEYGLTTERKQISVLQIINAYRFLGVRQAEPRSSQAPGKITRSRTGSLAITD